MTERGVMVLLRVAALNAERPLSAAFLGLIIEDAAHRDVHTCQLFALTKCLHCQRG